MKNVMNKFMGAALFTGLTAMSAVTFDAQANIMQTAAKKPKASSLAAIKNEGRKLAKEMHALWKDSNEIAAEARSKKITDETCSNIDFEQVQIDIKSLKKDFTVNIDKQARLGGLTAVQKQQRLDGLDAVEKGLQDNVKVIRAGCPQSGMRDAVYRIVADDQQQIERKPRDKVDQLAFARLESSRIQRFADALVQPSNLLANDAKKGNVSKAICDVIDLPINKNFPVDLMSNYRQSVQAEVDHGGETPENLNVRLGAMQKMANGFKSDYDAVYKACFRAYGL